MMPATAPDAINTATAAITVVKLSRGGPIGEAGMVLNTLPQSASTAVPATTPFRPATSVSTTDSFITIATIDSGVAPSALRTPISLVRSLTVISMMFETPTTPASRVAPPNTQPTTDST